MTQIEQLISKIEEKLRNYKTALENTSYMTGQYVGLQAKIALCEELLEAARAILKEPASEDLEQAAKEYAYYEREDDVEGDGGYDLSKLEGFIEGAQWDREQIMKSAIDAHVNMEWNHLSLGGFAWSQTGLDLGDKCKLIIIKE